MTYTKDATKKRMDGAVEVLQKEFAGLRTGRASASLMDPVMVEAYGNRVPINQVGTVNVPEPRLVIVQVWDQSLVKSVEKAIRDSGLGLNPQPDGSTIRVPIPELSQERRVELGKVAGKYAEAARVSVRNVRRDCMDTIKKVMKVSEDEQKRMSDEVQKMTDEAIKKIDGMLTDKEKEIMKV